jgi:hypothetical protein
MPVRILPDLLTFYRVHENNAFLMVNPNPERLRHKQESLATLAKTLSQRLAQMGVAPEVRGALLDYTQACADQLRLGLDGGWPWETVNTEWKVYRVTHPDAPPAHLIFKSLTMLGALFMAPKSFYRTQRRLAQNSVYRRIRDRWLPFPEMRHIKKEV